MQSAGKPARTMKMALMTRIGRLSEKSWTFSERTPTSPTIVPRKWKRVHRRVTGGASKSIFPFLLISSLVWSDIAESVKERKSF